MSQRQAAGELAGTAPSASPEASGGAGTVMEHRYGATLLAALVLHEPVPGLGGVLVPVKVAFQKADLTPVDDLVVTAEGAGAVVTWYVAARRKPVIGGSQAKTVALFATYLRLLRAEDLAFKAGTALLGLAVKGPHGPADDLDVLCRVAAAQWESAAFRRTVAGRAKPLRDRLKNVDDIVAAAAKTLAWTPDIRSARDWSWTLLRVLRVVQTFLDDGGQDAVALTGRLAAFVEGGVEQADTCRKELNDLAAGYASAGADVAAADVCRRLVGHVRLASAPDMAAAGAVLAERERELNLQTPRRLRGIRDGVPVELAVDRTEVVDALGAAMRAVGETAGTLVVHGEPSVGKSVLTLEAVDKLRADGAAVTVLGLRSPLDVGIPLPRLFGALAVGSVRLLVLDGAEAVQEDGRAAFLAIADAAITAGFGVVAVTRDDAQATVVKALQDFTGMAPAELTVEPLSVGDVEDLARSFPAFARLLDRRSRWLLRRVGLVDLLLRGGLAAPLRDGAFSEADVFDACWRGWVRRDEASPPGSPSPDAREQALLDVARERLGVSTIAGVPDAMALPSLRSDGLLLPYSPLRLQEDFPNDVVRDLATARLLIRATAALLMTAGTPRWALRAARISCQGRLVGAGAGAVTELERQLEFFDTLGAKHGGRWGDVPWEAMLSSGVAPDVLRDAAPLLLAERGRRLADLLRVADQHFCADGAVIDPVLVEPLITWLGNHAWGGLNVPSEIVESADKLVLMWLRGVRRDKSSDADPTTRDVRQRLRDAVLERELRGGGYELLEAFATLGVDLDDRAREVLRDIAEKRPAYLYPVVENVDAVLSLAQHDSALLAELAEAYYIEQPRKDRWSHIPILGEGVRSHRTIGLLIPRAAWWYGPFWVLLRADLRRGLTLITTLLHHAATAKVAHLDQRDGEEKRLTVDLLGLGGRTYVGDSHVYGWYRGGTFGPEPCTSALLACERMMDQLVATGVSLRRVARLLLAGARDLASVGLVVGFLVRHLDLVTDELDDFLAVPELWDLELGRASAEIIGMRVHDEDDVRGRHLRRRTFREVVILLAARAVEQRDDAAASRLRAVADRLRLTGSGGDGRPSLDVRMRTSLLDTTNYTEVELGGICGYEYHEPPDVAAELHNERRELDRVHDMYGLMNRYNLTLAPPFLTGEPEIDDVEQLRCDVALARDLANAPPAMSVGQAMEAVTAVAAAAVRVVATVDASALDREDVAWATQCVLAAAQDSTCGKHVDEDSLFSFGEDRSAAAALACLLLPAFHDNRLTPLRLETNDVKLVDLAFTSSTTSSAHEVRRIIALGLRRLWAAPCGPEQAPCRHHIAWAAVKAGARDVAMAPWDASGARKFAGLSGGLEQALRQANAENLALPRLSAALVSAVHAAASAPCLVTEALALRDALLNAYSRTAVHYADEGYDFRDEESAAVADALLLATDDDPTLLSRTVAAMGGCSLATAHLLEGLCTVATYDERRREQLRRVWLDLFATALDLPEPEIDKIFRGRAIAALVPSPRPLSTDKDIDGSLVRARLGWPTAGQLAPLIERWLPVAAGERDAVSHLARLLIGSPRDEQLRLGLPWIRRLVAPVGGPPVLDGFVLIDLLKVLRDRGPLQDEAGTDYEVIVDTLAAGGIVGARELQQCDE